MWKRNVDFSFHWRKRQVLSGKMDMRAEVEEDGRDTETTNFI